MSVRLQHALPVFFPNYKSDNCVFIIEAVFCRATFGIVFYCISLAILHMLILIFFCAEKLNFNLIIKHLRASIFKSYRFSIRPVLTWHKLAQAVRLGSLPCWNVNLFPSFKSFTASNSFSPWITLHVDPFIFLFLQTSHTLQQKKNSCNASLSTKSVGSDHLSLCVHFRS